MIPLNKLLNKFKEGTCSKNELDELINLMKNPLSEDDVKFSMFKHWNECDNSETGDPKKFEQILNQIHHEINTKEKRDIQLRKLYTSLSRVAAIAIIPLIITFFYLGKVSNQKDFTELQNTISVPYGATSKFILPDGTEVMLNSGSSLTYPSDINENPERLVNLNGEAYFKVKKCKEKPFLINMDGMDIKVTGTMFNVRNYNDELNVVVALEEGSVVMGKKLEDKNFDIRSSLKPNNVAIYNKASKKMQVLDEADLTKYLAWTRGITIFDNDPIETVINKMEKLYNLDIVIQDKELINYRLTATFNGEPLEQALKIISLSSGINYQLIQNEADTNSAFNKRTLILKKRRN